jgi:hypothetical protein
MPVSHSPRRSWPSKRRRCRRRDAKKSIPIRRVVRRARAQAWPQRWSSYARAIPLSCGSSIASAGRCLISSRWSPSARAKACLARVFRNRSIRPRAGAHWSCISLWPGRNLHTSSSTNGRGRGERRPGRGARVEAAPKSLMRRPPPARQYCTTRKSSREKRAVSCEGLARRLSIATSSSRRRQGKPDQAVLPPSSGGIVSRARSGGLIGCCVLDRPA